MADALPLRTHLLDQFSHHTPPQTFCLLSNLSVKSGIPQLHFVFFILAGATVSAQQQPINMPSVYSEDRKIPARHHRFSRQCDKMRRHEPPDHRQSSVMSLINRFRAIVGNKPGETATAEVPAAEWTDRRKRKRINAVKEPASSSSTIRRPSSRRSGRSCAR